MISTFIIENYVLVRVILVVAAVAAVVLCALLVRAGRTGRRLSGVIAAVALVVVLGLTLAPDSEPTYGAGCYLQVDRFLNDEWNVILFLLPALFAVVAVRRPLLVLAGGLILSALIELVQLLTPMLGRLCDADDWLANGAGTVAGVLVAMIVAAIVERFSRRGLISPRATRRRGR
ncbi:MAG: hypothetical protein JWQ43_939, partial [Glaciihabitans sp.]|nr:hypothetical protein [Glaciihabitans sp.]